jgi:hypothetical protein
MHAPAPSGCSTQHKRAHCSAHPDGRRDARKCASYVVCTPVLQPAWRDGQVSEETCSNTSYNPIIVQLGAHPNFQGKERSRCYRCPANCPICNTVEAHHSSTSSPSKLALTLRARSSCSKLQRCQSRWVAAGLGRAATPTTLPMLNSWTFPCAIPRGLHTPPLLAPPFGVLWANLANPRPLYLGHPTPHFNATPLTPQPQLVCG